MRRFVLPIVSGLLLLSACNRAGSLAPTDVLNRATSAAADLQSAEYDVQVDFGINNKTVDATATAALHGAVARGGQESAFSLTLKASSKRAGQSTTVDLAGDVVTDAKNVFVQLHTLAISPETTALHNSKDMLNKWWQIARDDTGASLHTLTPDPSFLRAQSAVVTVTKDKGIETVNGRDAYHYLVTIDPERLLALMKTSAEARGTAFDATATRAELAQYNANGELWIDAETFVLHKLSWTVTSKETPPAMHLQFTVGLGKHNQAGPIAIPTKATPFQPELLIQRLLSSPGAL